MSRKKSTRNANRGELTQRLRSRNRQARAAVSAAKSAVEQMQKTSMLLCAVLAQAGGSIVVTTGTLTQVVQTAPNLGFKMTETTPGKEFTIMLLEKDAEEKPLDDAVIEEMPIASPAPDAKVSPIVITG